MRAPLFQLDSDDAYTCLLIFAWAFRGVAQGVCRNICCARAGISGLDGDGGHMPRRRRTMPTHVVSFDQSFLVVCSFLSCSSRFLCCSSGVPLSSSVSLTSGLLYLTFFVLLLSLRVLSSSVFISSRLQARTQEERRRFAEEQVVGEER